MGYTKLGYRKVPPSMFLPAYAGELASGTRGAVLEATLAECLKQISSNGSRRLSNLVFEDLLQINTTAFPAGSDQQRKLLHVLLAILNKMGYIQLEVPMYEQRADAVLAIDDAVGQMLSARLTFMQASDVGGEYATVDNLRAVLPNSIRMLSFADTERGRLTERLRRYVQHVGFKLLHGQAITQHEKTLFVAYCSTRVGSAGHSPTLDKDADGPVLPPFETADPLVMEAFSLYETFCEGGPCWNYIMMGSDKNMERLTAFVGELPSEVTVHAGTLVPFGPFTAPNFEQIEGMKWSVADQMAGVTDGGDYIMRELSKTGTLAIRPPRFEITNPEGRLTSFLPDAAELTLRLESSRDCSQYSISWMSNWRNRVMNTHLSGLTIDDFFLDQALSFQNIGGTAFDETTLTNTGIADLTHASLAGAFKTAARERITEIIYVPASDSRQLGPKEVDMTDFYVRQGMVITTSVLADRVKPARPWYSIADENAITFIAARLSLSNDETKRFRTIINIAHNAARFERLTGATPPFDTKAYCAAVGGFTI